MDNLQQEKDIRNEELDSIDINEDIEEFTSESEPVPEIKMENDDDADVDPKLLATPIVYTTRLDHMTALHSSFYRKNANTILNDVCEESKPQLRHSDNNYKQQPVTSFRWVKRRLTQLNKKVIADIAMKSYNGVERQNSDDFSFYVFSDNKYAEYVVKQELEEESEEESNTASMCKPCYVPLQRVDPKATRPRKKCSGNSAVNVYMIQDRSLNETHIFYLEQKVIIDYHRLKGINDADLEQRNDAYEKLGKRTMLIKACCWYRRQDIVSLLSNENIPEHVIAFMKTPHKCLHGKCVCCCGSFSQRGNKKYETFIKFSDNSQEETSMVLHDDMEIQNLEKELSETFHRMKQGSAFNEYGYNYNWLQDLLSKNSNNSLINRALNYNPPIANKQMKNRTQKLTSTLFKRFYCHHENISLPTVECFELNTYGNIKMYAKNLPSCVIKKLLDDLNVVSDDYKMCCWRKRNLIIKNNFHTVPDLARFLRSPHSCIAGKCVCCCSSEPLAKKITLDNITLPERTTPTHPVSITKIYKKITQINKNIKSTENSIGSTQVSPIPMGNTDKDDDCVLVDENSDSMTRGQNNQMLRKDRKEEPVDCSSVQTTKTMSDPTLSQPFSHTPEIVSEAEKLAANDNAQASALDIFNSVLTRFEGVRLTMGADGKVAATLKTPVHSMSTAELKVLANILNHAQRQVEVIEIAKDAKKGTKSVETNTTDVQSKPTKSIQNRANKETNPENSMFSREKVCNNFAELFTRKSVTSLSAFTDYVSQNNKQIMAEPTTPPFPVITSVFSLKDTNLNNTKGQTNEVKSTRYDEDAIFEIAGTHKVAKTVPKQNTGAQKSVLVKQLETPSLKRKSKDETSPAGKIRVVDPTKLGLTKSFDEPDKNLYGLRTEPETQNTANRDHLQGGSNYYILPQNTAAFVIPPPGTLNQTSISNSNVCNPPGQFCLNRSQPPGVQLLNTIFPQVESEKPTAPVTYVLQRAGNGKFISLIPVTTVVGDKTHGNANPPNL